MLESAIAFVKRRQKQKGVWDGADQKVLDAMVRDSIVWKGARADPSTERYVSFLAAHPDSPFAEEAKARIVDLEVGEMMRGEHGELPAAELR